MKKVTISCRVITLLFMGGAKQQAELRPQSIKGLMRWFWRAIKCENNIEKLKKEEAEIFGDENLSSKVRIVLISNPIKEGGNKNIKKDFRLDWKYNKTSKSLEGTHKGLAYLLYSTALPGREREYIKPNSEFKLEISSFYEEALNQALASFWAVVYLGGLGTRSRRGGGNLEVIKIEGDTKIDINFIIKGKNSEEVADWIKENFNKVVRIISKDKNADFAFEYSNLSFSRFIISRENFGSWIDALNEIGKIYYDFRFRHRRNIFGVGSFGLPVMHGKESLESIKKRRASPLIIKVLRSEEKYYWFVLRLFGKFLEEGNLLKFGNETQKPDYTLIDEFWNELKNHGNEYILNTPKILDKIVSKIRAELNPSKIYIYGSRARGDAYKNSDIDIAVETDAPLEKLQLNAPVDLVNIKKVNNDLKKKIKREGILLYERKG
ncbi:MAG: type III-B CRISPR module RAMP protein Cmr1 [candidate division WOR-3 bacterium]